MDVEQRITDCLNLCISGFNRDRTRDMRSVFSEVYSTLVKVRSELTSERQRREMAEESAEAEFDRHMENLAREDQAHSEPVPAVH